MSTSALILMILVQGSVVLITAYFLIKVLKTPTKSDTESTEDAGEQIEP